MANTKTHIDFLAERPFFGAGNSELADIIETKLRPEELDIEIASFAYEELARRNKSQRGEKIFNAAKRKPIPWLKEAIASLDILEDPEKGRYQGHLYVILIEGYTEYNGYYGAYVGSSRYLPETRFQKHKEGGITASPRVHRRGLQILKSLSWPGRTGTVPGGKDIRNWESALHKCLERTTFETTRGTDTPLKVSGDFKSFGEWPSGFQEPLRRWYEEQERPP